MPVSAWCDTSLRFRRFSFYLMKSLLIGAASALAFAPAAIAGPFYVNVENNGGFDGSGDGLSFVGSTTDLHIGIEGGKDAVSGYAQAGPALLSPDGEDTTVEFSGKAGGAVAISESASIYGEVSFMTVDQGDYANYGTKVGIKVSL